MSQLSRPIKAVFFDWDGTLVNTIPTIFKAHNIVREAYGLPLMDKATFYENVKFSSRESYPRIYQDKAEEALTMLYDVIADIHLNEIETLPHSKDALERLHGEGLTIGIISNKKHEYLLREIDHLGWREFVHVAGGAGYATEDKPSAAPLIKAMQEVSIAPEDMLFVGDTITDILAAKNAGSRIALVMHDETQDALRDEHNPDYTISHCLDLYEQIFPAVHKIKAC